LHVALCYESDGILEYDIFQLEPVREGAMPASVILDLMEPTFGQAQGRIGAVIRRYVGKMAGSASLPTRPTKLNPGYASKLQQSVPGGMLRIFARCVKEDPAPAAQSMASAKMKAASSMSALLR
jgi:hypothetical protein